MARTQAPRVAKSKPTPEPPARAVTVTEETDPAPEPVDAAVLADIRGRWPMPNNERAAAYRSQFSEDSCYAEGAKTKSPLVLADANGWAVKIDATLVAGKKVAYPGTRFAWFLSQVSELSDEIDAQRLSQGATVEVKRAAEDEEKAAREMNEELGGILEEIAGDRAKESGDIKKALSTLKTPGDPLERLNALIGVGKSFQKRAAKDVQLRALIEDFELTPALVASAERVAKRLARLRPQARGTRIEPRDTPAVNRIEGRVLLEMKLVMRVFARARKRDKTIPALVPSAGTRASLATRPKGNAGAKKTPGAPADTAKPDGK